MPSPLFVLSMLCAARAAFGAQLVEVHNFGYNPTGIRMFEYVPDRVAQRPALLVANHWRGGDGQQMYNASKYATAADQFGFIVIYPSVTRSDKTWDVFSSAALKRDGGGDPQGIMSMVNYEIQKRNVDRSKIYVTGWSSGAMMTNLLLAEYPDFFAAGSAFSGVAYTCFMCNQSPEQLGAAVRNAFPGYKGKRPRMQLLHGMNDDVLPFGNLQMEVNQWSNVLGVGLNPTATDTPNVQMQGVTAIRKRYGGTGNQPPLEAIALTNTQHWLPLGGILADMALRFMGLMP